MTNKHDPGFGRVWARHANPTGRNTQAYAVSIGTLTLYFSYETLVAMSGPGIEPCRLPNLWGPTTGRHINEMGVRDWPEVEADEMQRRLATTLVHQAFALLPTDIEPLSVASTLREVRSGG